MTGIMFFSGGWTVGGIERVTVTLANEFVKRGRKVVVCFFVLEDSSLLGQLDERVRIEKLPDGSRYSVNTLVTIRRIVKENNVGFILNAFRMNFLFRLACLGLSVRQISCIHSKPNVNGRILKARTTVTRSFWRVVTSLSRRVSYMITDCTVVLSESYKRSFCKFIGIKIAQKLYAINNPLTLNSVSNCKKEKLLLYVGRMQETPKKISRVIEIWRDINEQLPDWRMVIVGDGPDKDRYINLSADLPRLEFTGFCDPTEYYGKASILLLVSDYEGWPLVLTEAMVFGCIPIALGSYEAIYDIIKDGTTGFVLPMPYSRELFDNVILNLAADGKLRTCMADSIRAIASSRFGVMRIVDQWQSLMDRISP